MIHKNHKHDDTNYKLLSYALRNDISVAAERINNAYQLLLARKDAGYPVSPSVIWYCEQSLIDLDRPDLVTTCFGEPLPANDLNQEICKVCDLFPAVNKTGYCEIHLDNILDCSNPEYCRSFGCAGECSNNPRIENTTEALVKELERLENMSLSLSPFVRYQIMLDDITKEINRRKGGE